MDSTAVQSVYVMKTSVKEILDASCFLTYLSCKEAGSSGW